MNIIKYTLLLLILLSVISCKDFLEPQPTQTISDAFERSSAQLLNMANGMYDQLQDGDLFGFNLIGVSAFMADDAVFQGSFTSFQEMATKTMIASNVDVTATWQDAYQAINRANTLLENLPLATTPFEDVGTTEEQLRGEALFIRALVHFELSRFYSLPWSAQGGTQDAVPLIVDATTTPDQLSNPLQPERDVLETVYSQVIIDAEEAIKLLDENGSRGVNFASADAARALLVRVYLNKGDYNKALDYAGQLINSGRYVLNPGVMDFFNNKNSSESIFEVAMNAQDNPTTGSLASYHSPGPPFGSGRGDIIATQSLLNSYRNGGNASDTVIDKRLRDMYRIGGDQRFTSKYFRDGDNSDNAPVFRYAEILLSAAEARVLINNAVDEVAIDYLNEVYMRAVEGQGAKPFESEDFASASELLDEIRLERRIELCFEGQRLHDLRRYEATDIDGNGIPWDADVLVFPIPQREIDANENLIQNPGY